ncbi:hypothetical protein AMAG_08189 [Allomyces macrogynus ATCC 38327]|uniref:TauD/TfdA-like domain-containing protein n=1 Tax=Allomyces macrogynus (strain ATCC 38327) TaxID=578462 RepID=A0A0L0SKJ4_ALLM3|nr:hypothetical protein AMAG_08189 [Allomyces macrogynus ATCC 38327]|eukprot:KNE63022.1 hypothetical protein AMAG_08189 [Allomyces macrogynus ATCC 38327]
MFSAPRLLAAAAPASRTAVRPYSALAKAALTTTTRHFVQHTTLTRSTAVAAVALPSTRFLVQQRRALATATTSSTPPAAPFVHGNRVDLALYGDGKTLSQFHHVWLRDHCPCARCVHPSTRQKLHASGDIPLDIAPKAVRWERATGTTAVTMDAAASDAWELVVEWPAFVLASQTAAAGNVGVVDTNAAAAEATTHVSRYPLSYLQRWDYTHPARGRAAADSDRAPTQPRPVAWSKDGHKDILHVDYRDLPPLESLIDPLGPLQAASGSADTVAERTRATALPAVEAMPAHVLDAFATHGLVFFHNVPLDRGNDYVETLAKRFGYAIRHTFYGPSWDVKSVAHSANVAYTAQFLGLHMDLMYFEAPPGLQFLHMLQSSTRGGASLFLDMWHAWQTFAQSHPQDLVDALANVPVSYHYAHAHHATVKDATSTPHHLHFRHPLASQRTLSGANTHASDDAVARDMYYAPPFQAPLEASPDQVEVWYRAMSLWEEHMRAQPMFTIQMKPGDCVLFHNRRVLHGRTAFEVGKDGQGAGGQRHLRGVYVDWDDFKDRWRVANWIKSQTARK